MEFPSLAVWLHEPDAESATAEGENAATVTAVVHEDGSLSASWYHEPKVCFNDRQMGSSIDVITLCARLVWWSEVMSPLPPPSAPPSPPSPPPLPPPPPPSPPPPAPSPLSPTPPACPPPPSTLPTPTPLAPPVVAEALWTKSKGFNCYPGHGATDIDTAGPAANAKTLAACKAICEATTECEGIIMLRQTGGCFLKAAIELSRCADDGHNAFADTYTIERPLPPAAENAQCKWSGLQVGRDRSAPEVSTIEGVSDLRACLDLCCFENECRGVQYWAEGPKALQCHLTTIPPIDHHLLPILPGAQHAAEGAMTVNRLAPEPTAGRRTLGFRSEAELAVRIAPTETAVGLNAHKVHPPPRLLASPLPGLPPPPFPSLPRSIATTQNLGCGQLGAEGEVGAVGLGWRPHGVADSFPPVAIVALEGGEGGGSMLVHLEGAPTSIDARDDGDSTREGSSGPHRSSDGSFQGYDNALLTSEQAPHVSQPGARSSSSSGESGDDAGDPQSDESLGLSTRTYGQQGLATPSWLGGPSRVVLVVSLLLASLVIGCCVPRSRLEHYAPVKAVASQREYELTSDDVSGPNGYHDDDDADREEELQDYCGAKGDVEDGTNSDGSGNETFIGNMILSESLCTLKSDAQERTQVSWVDLSSEGDGARDVTLQALSRIRRDHPRQLAADDRTSCSAGHRPLLYFNSGQGAEPKAVSSARKGPRKSTAAVESTR